MKTGDERAYRHAIATNHIHFLGMTQSNLQTRIEQAAAELARLRHFNEPLAFGSAEEPPPSPAPTAVAPQAQEEQEAAAAPEHR